MVAAPQTHEDTAETVQEAPYTHVEDDEAAAQSESNVVSLHGLGQEAGDAEPDEAPAPEPQQTDAAPAPEQDAQDEVAELAEAQDDMPAPAVSEAPAAHIPDDPDPATIAAPARAVEKAQRLAALRQLGLSTELAEGSETQLAQLMARLEALRARMSRDGSAS